MAENQGQAAVAEKPAAAQAQVPVTSPNEANTANATNAAGQQVAATPGATASNSPEVKQAGGDAGKSQSHATMPLPAPVEPVLDAEQQKKRAAVIDMIKSIGGTAQPTRLALSQIEIDRSNNIRMEQSYTEEDILQMMEQIKTAGGLIQPLVVIPLKPTAENGMKEYGLIIGYRRSLALKRLEEEDPRYTASVPVLVAAGVKSEAAVRMLQILENKGRKDLSPMEEAQTIRAILDDRNSNFSQKEVARMLGYTDSQVSKLLAFMNFPGEIQEAINDGSLGFHNADRLRRDVPESQWAATLDLAKSKTQKEFDKYCDDLKAKYSGESDKTDDGEGGESSGSTGSQKPATMLRSKAVEEVYIPFLKEQKGKVDSTEKKYTEQDILDARIDTLKTVTLASDTSLAKMIAPHLEAQKAKEAAEKAAEEATSKAKAFWKDKVRDAEKLVALSSKPDPKNPEKQPLTTAAAYVSVLNDVYALSDEKKKELGFELPKTKEEAAQILRQAHSDLATERENADKKRKDAKAAKELKAKQEEEERKKAAAGEPHQVTTHPAKDPNAGA